MKFLEQLLAVLFIIFVVAMAVIPAAIETYRKFVEWRQREGKADA